MLIIAVLFTATILCIGGMFLLHIAIAERIRKLEDLQELDERSIADLRDVDRTLHGILHGLRNILEQDEPADVDAGAYTGDDAFDDNIIANGDTAFADSIANAQFLPSPSEWKGGIGVECEPIHWEPGPAKSVFARHDTLDEG